MGAMRPGVVFYQPALATSINMPETTISPSPPRPVSVPCGSAPWMQCGPAQCCLGMVHTEGSPPVESGPSAQRASPPRFIAFIYQGEDGNNKPDTLRWNKATKAPAYQCGLELYRDARLNSRRAPQDSRPLRPANQRFWESFV
eukprot:scaffold11065_cov22-Tisochrysis_lutea.AAC.1